MIILDSIRVRNFRAIKEATFKPLEKGITGILGPNGAGKTTFLAATLFALFGVKPPGASIGSLRRSGSGKQESSASVVFKHLKQTVEVIRELKGSNNRVVVNIYVDGVPQTVTSVGAADTWISQRLGVDAQGFMTAFIVRQKELDALVTARPAERKQVIEKLAGIETINDALKKSRKDENLAKEVLNNLPGSTAAIDEAESQVLFLTQKVDEISFLKKDLQTQLLDKQNFQKGFSDELDVLRNLESQIFRNETLLTSLEEENKNHVATLERLKYLKTISKSFDINLLREQHKSLVETISEKTKQLNVLRVERTGLENKISETETTLKEISEKIVSTNISINEEHTLLEKKVIVTEILETALNDRSSAEARQKDIEDNILILEHSTECPTCHTHLENPAALIQNLKTRKEELAVEILVHKKALEQNRVIQTETNTKLSTIKILNEWKKEFSSLQTEIVLLKEKLNLLKSDDLLVEEIEQLSIEKETVSETGMKAKNVINDQELFDEADTKLTVNVRKIQTIKQELSEFQKHFSPERIVFVRNQLDTLGNEIQKKVSSVNEIFSELSGFESRLAVANNTFRSVTEQWKRKKELFVAQEKQALTTELIEKFRQESVSSLTPELSDYATELISGITNGAYTEIQLDDEFNVNVISSTGEVRNVSWLSGGEESAVAFALRLAIAFLITGGNPTLLWLDEVLTAQDEDRRNSMLSTIRKLPIDQIIMINHATGAEDILDKSVIVIPDIDNGSILESAEENVLSSAEVSLDDIDNDIEDNTDFI